MMNWLRRFMYGRYGNDQLGNFLFGVFIVLFIFQTIFRRMPTVYTVLLFVGYAVILVYFFRSLSRNIYRRQAENQKFLRLWNPVKNYFKFWHRRIKERNGVHKLYRCPKCHQTIRVPKGRGKIAIRCPKCRFEFIKKT